jgi:hypothetical protein
MASSVKSNRGSSLRGVFGLALLAIAGTACSDAERGKACPAIACSYATQLGDGMVDAGSVTAIDVQFCFNDDCRDGTIELVRTDDAYPCVYFDLASTYYTGGKSSVCLIAATPPAPTAVQTDASGIYRVSATWQHDSPTRPTDGSTYSLSLRDHASNASLFSETEVAVYVNGPDFGGCLPGCWGAQLSPVDGGADAGTPPVDQMSSSADQAGP